MVFQENLAHCIHTDSAGTHAYHVGEPPDRRAQATVMQYGIDISDLRARRVATNDFSQFHYILAMDQDNLDQLLAACPANYQDRVRLFLDFAPKMLKKEVPDPYYGGQAGFAHVYELVDAASRGLLAEIRQRLRCK